MTDVPKMTAATPRCPSCNSADMTVGGFVTFHWRKGKLSPKRRTTELADGAPWHCGGCGAQWQGAYDAPFGFFPDNTSLRPA